MEKRKRGRTAIGPAIYTKLPPAHVAYIDSVRGEQPRAVFVRIAVEEWVNRARTVAMVQEMRP